MNTHAMFTVMEFVWLSIEAAHDESGCQEVHEDIPTAIACIDQAAFDSAFDIIEGQEMDYAEPTWDQQVTETIADIKENGFEIVGHLDSDGQMVTYDTPIHRPYVQEDNTMSDRLFDINTIPARPDPMPSMTEFLALVNQLHDDCGFTPVSEFTHAIETWSIVNDADDFLFVVDEENGGGANEIPEQYQHYSTNTVQEDNMNNVTPPPVLYPSQEDTTMNNEPTTTEEQEPQGFKVGGRTFAPPSEITDTNVQEDTDMPPITDDEYQPDEDYDSGPTALDDLNEATVDPEVYAEAMGELPKPAHEVNVFPVLDFIVESKTLWVNKDEMLTVSYDENEHLRITLQRVLEQRPDLKGLAGTMPGTNRILHATPEKVVTYGSGQIRKTTPGNQPTTTSQEDTVNTTSKSLLDLKRAWEEAGSNRVKIDYPITEILGLRYTSKRVDPSKATLSSTQVQFVKKHGLKFVTVLTLDGVYAQTRKGNVVLLKDLPSYMQVISSIRSEKTGGSISDARGKWTGFIEAVNSRRSNTTIAFDPKVVTIKA